MNGVVYIDKHVQPSTDPCLAGLMQAQYGNINATVFIRDVAPMLQTGAILFIFSYFYI